MLWPAPAGARRRESGKLKLNIDRRFPLSQTADAIRYLRDGQALGKVIVHI